MPGSSEPPPHDGTNPEIVDGPRSAFIWRDRGRFIEVYRVATGWLVLWGRYKNLGRQKLSWETVATQILPG